MRIMCRWCRGEARDAGYTAAVDFQEIVQKDASYVCIHIVQFVAENAAVKLIRLR